MAWEVDLHTDVDDLPLDCYLKSSHFFLILSSVRGDAIFVGSVCEQKRRAMPHLEILQWAGKRAGCGGLDCCVWVFGRSWLPPKQLISELSLVNNTIKEILRIHPPLHSIMRKVKSPLHVPDSNLVIPSTHFVMAAPGVSAMDEKYFKNAKKTCLTIINIGVLAIAIAMVRAFLGNSEHAVDP